MPRAAIRCAACDREFDAGELHQAVVIDAGEAFERKDLCLGCPPPSLLEPLAAWRVRRPHPQTKARPVLDREALYGVFSRLSDGDERRRRFRFGLALLLWRKRVLQLADTISRDGEELWCFDAPRRDERFEVVRPDLDEEAVERVSAELELLLSGDAAVIDEADGVNSEPVDA
ncbi:MAG: hypothetical protein IPM64_11585 [Phycisphaerales bacterium]|nr:hypothetical protein [Phycisphaerales bacterium]